MHVALAGIARPEAMFEGGPDCMLWAEIPRDNMLRARPGRHILLRMSCEKKRMQLAAPCDTVANSGDAPCWPWARRPPSCFLCALAQLQMVNGCRGTQQTIVSVLVGLILKCLGFGDER